MEGKRRGANHAIKRPRTDVASKTYPNARKKLHEIIKLFSFIKVSEVTHVPPTNGRPAFFHGIGLTISNSKYENSGEIKERVFFDKGGRLRYNATFDIGPCKLIDAAWGRDHSSASPQIGDILIGVLEPNEKSGKGKPSKILRSWSRHGKIVLELSRIVEFGTAVKELDTRKLLRQTECDMMQQVFAMRALGAAAGMNQNSGKEGDMEQNVINAADDFWMLARIVLWGNLRPFCVMHFMQSTNIQCKEPPTAVELSAVSTVKISCSAYEFISSIAFKLEDPEILNDFVENFKMENVQLHNYSSTGTINLPPLPPPPPQPQILQLSTFSNPINIGDYVKVNNGDLEGLTGDVYSFDNYGMNASIIPSQESRNILNITAQYLSIPLRILVRTNRATIFQGSSRSPPRNAGGSATPVYEDPPSPGYAPSSPAYAPSSPPYAPSSPPYLNIEEGEI
jgi:hypothetical protein